MRNSRYEPWGRPVRLNSYWVYSVGCAVAWAIIWILLVTDGSAHARRTWLLVFGGWVTGWLGATIARLVYPPPKPRASAGPRSYFQGFRPN